MLTVRGVKITLMRLPRPALCIPAARRRDPLGRTLAAPAKVGCHDSRALHTAEVTVVAFPKVCCRVCQDDERPSTDVSDAAAGACHVGVLLSC